MKNKNTVIPEGFPVQYLPPVPTPVSRCTAKPTCHHRFLTAVDEGIHPQFTAGRRAGRQVSGE